MKIPSEDGNSKKSYDIIGLSVKKTGRFRGVAQLVARVFREYEVAGSNPVTPAITMRTIHAWIVFFDKFKAGHQDDQTVCRQGIVRDMPRWHEITVRSA